MLSARISTKVKKNCALRSETLPQRVALMNSKRQKVLLQGTPHNLFAARFPSVICARKNLRANKTNLLTSRREFHAHFLRALALPDNKSHFCRYFARSRCACLRPTNTERTTAFADGRREKRGNNRRLLFAFGASSGQRRASQPAAS